MLEQLVVGRGQSIERPLEKVTLRGIAFKHTTWLGPNSPDGYVPLQANVRLVGKTTQIMGSARR
eukprot:2893003-Prymnesium_polylepis.1